MAKSHGFLKYTLLAIGGQFVACTAIWIATIVLHPMLGSVFEAMVFAYWPLIVLVSLVLESLGEHSMIAAPILGMLIGMVVYGTIFGFIVSSFKRKQ